MICKDGVIAFATPEQLANLNWKLAKCLVAPYSPEELEAVKKWRYNMHEAADWKWRTLTYQGRFEISMLSYDRLAMLFDDPSKASLLSDGGAGAERTIARCDCEMSDPVYGLSKYAQTADAARKALKEAHPELVEVFNLILRNGKRRGASIGEIAANHNLGRKAANWRYHDHLEKISLFFGVPINQGENDDETADC